ncbi:uncharacterized protein LOC131248818 [Magnolia sinica]|uniref:uncharacterized protein LOC131248818 n=1 Tax=Magnolia sinica TaxID=86752 RepID=UPI0026592770|nr:uncharacterized protein LOC131248818 [Magnolia sinica]
MEESRRFRPIQGTNTCPTCSISHFPFCPQPLPLNHNGPGPDNLHRFPMDHNLSFQKPFLNPHPDNHPMPFPGPGPFSHPNTNLFPGNAFGVPDSSHSWDRNQMQAIRGAFFPEEFDERTHKRMRVDDMDSGPFTQMILPVRNGYTSAENERRLNLIREHGGQSITPDLSFELGPGLVRDRSNTGSTRSFEYDYRTDRYFQGTSIQEKRSEGQRIGGVDWRGSMVSNNFNNSGFDSVAEARPVLPPGQELLNQLNHPVHVNVHDPYRSFRRADNFQDETNRGYSSGFEHQRMQSNSNGFQCNAEYTVQNREETAAATFYNSQDEQHPHSRYRLPDIPLHALQSHRPRNFSMGALNHEDPAGQSQDLLVHHGEDRDLCQKMNWVGQSFINPDQGKQNQSDRFSRVSHEDFHAYGQQQFHPKEYSSGIPSNQPQNPHTATWQAANAQHWEPSSHLPIQNHLPNDLLPQQLHTMQLPVVNRHEFHGRHIDATSPFDLKVPLHEEYQRSVEPQSLPVVEQSDAWSINKHGGYSSLPAASSMIAQTFGTHHCSASLLPQPLSKAPSALYPSHYQAPSPPRTSSPLWPIPASSSATVASPLPSAIRGLPEGQPLAQDYYNKPLSHASTGLSAEGSQFIHQALPKQYVEEGPPFQPKHSQPDKPKVINAAHLFRQPHRATRPDHIVVILRGLPGSGKSYLAKILRNLEVANGGNAPRIHSMDDYFMTEVEKVEEIEASKPSSSVKGKKRITKKVMEYCYEPEMEEAYRSSMLKAFKKTLEEGAFTFIIVDDRNLRVADFAQFWATAKRSGYEVYLLEASYKDPMGCAARNVHGFTTDEIQKMAEQWEQAPSLYLQLDVQSLFHGDDLKECSIQEVDMDMDDVSGDEGGISNMQYRKAVKTMEPSLADSAHDDALSAEEKWGTERDDSAEAVKELGRSKWSEDIDDDIDRTEGAKGNLSAFSGLIKAYGKRDKSVRWGDQVGKSGFWIGAAKKSIMSSLLIGPGAGYNLDSNPLLEEDNADAIESNSGESRRRTVFLEQLRAECESFRAVFDRRRQRIVGLETEDE